MDTEIDWRRELDRSFGAGPDVPVGHYVDAGRRAVRRRRVAAVVVAATLVVAGSTAWAAGPGGAPRGDAPVATGGPSPTQREATDKRAERELRRQSLEELRAATDARIDFMGNPAALTDHGLVLAPRTGAVLQRVQNPMDYTEEQGRSLAIRAIYDGREQYSLMSWFPDGTSTSTVEATGDFAGWLDGAVRTQRTLDVANGVTAPTDESTPDQWLELGADGEVEAATDGVVLLEVRTGVDLGVAFSRGTDRTGVVSVLVDGQPEFAAYRVMGGQLEVIPGGGKLESLAAFITWARNQYASGEGMR